jgi:hypothetical protein
MHFEGLQFALFSGNGRCDASGPRCFCIRLSFDCPHACHSALTGRRRDFTSRKQIVATSYDVVCTWGKLDEAKALLAQMPAF